MFIHVYKYIHIYICIRMHIYIFFTHSLSSCSAKAGSRMRPRVLFVFASLLCSLPALLSVAGRAYHDTRGVSVPMAPRVSA